VELKPGELKLGDAQLRRTFAAVLATAVILTTFAAMQYGKGAAFSVAMGALLALSNLYVLSRIVLALAVPTGESPAGAGFSWAVITVGKIMVLFGGMWALMTWRVVSPIPLVVGYGSLPIGIAFGAVVSDKTGPRNSR
jgi:hypothetical protein